MTIAEKHFNDGYRAFRALLRQYMNPTQCRMLARSVREKLPTLRYFKESGRHGLKDNMATLSECYASLDATKPSYWQEIAGSAQRCSEQSHTGSNPEDGHIYALSAVPGRVNTGYTKPARSLARS